MLFFRQLRTRLINCGLRTCLTTPFTLEIKMKGKMLSLCREKIPVILFLKTIVKILTNEPPLFSFFLFFFSLNFIVEKLTNKPCTSKILEGNLLAVLLDCTRKSINNLVKGGEKGRDP